MVAISKYKHWLYNITSVFTKLFSHRVIKKHNEQLSYLRAYFSTVAYSIYSSNIFWSFKILNCTKTWHKHYRTFCYYYYTKKYSPHNILKKHVVQYIEFNTLSVRLPLIFSFKIIVFSWVFILEVWTRDLQNPIFNTHVQCSLALEETYSNLFL